MEVHLPTPHQKQAELHAAITAPRSRTYCQAGRRSGKTVGVANPSVLSFLQRQTVRYFTPAAEQCQSYWFWVWRALGGLVQTPKDRRRPFEGSFRERWIRWPGTEIEIRARTARDPDILRSGSADLLICDEYQDLASPELNEAMVPMLADRGGRLVLIGTPPNPRSAGLRVRQALKEWDERSRGVEPGWTCLTFSIFDNPWHDRLAVKQARELLSDGQFRREFLAEVVMQVEGAFWEPEWIQREHIERQHLDRVVVAVDPAAGAGTTGIIVCGVVAGQGWILEDVSMDSRRDWPSQAVRAYHRWGADAVAYERNQGGNSNEKLLAAANDGEPLPMYSVWARHGKAVRAEPIANLYRLGRVYHLAGADLKLLETEYTTWANRPRDPSPDRLDAAVIGLMQVMQGRRRPIIRGLG